MVGQENERRGHDAEVEVVPPVVEAHVEQPAGLAVDFGVGAQEPGVNRGIQVKVAVLEAVRQERIVIIGTPLERI